MIRLGDYNELRIDRSTRVGVFLCSEDDEAEVLLPTKYVPEDFQIDQKLKVFCYLDNQQRPIATTLQPKILRDTFAFLTVVEVNEFGAFLDWGIEKHLFVPFKEQQVKMEPFKSYVVHCYLDEKSFRLVASSRVDRFLNNEELTVQEKEEVDLLVYRKSKIGWEAIVNGKHKGLIFFSEVFKSISFGSQVSGYIKQIRSDSKLDLTLQPEGAKMLETTAEQIYNSLLENDGFLNIHDNSPPEEIKEKLQLSKKSFKKGVGVLLKQQKIMLENNGIRLVDN